MSDEGEREREQVNETDSQMWLPPQQFSPLTGINNRL